jgi:hypothetical protein
MFRTFGQTELNFASWIAFNVPEMLLNLFLTWVWLQVVLTGSEKHQRYSQHNKRTKTLLIDIAFLMTHFYTVKPMEEEIKK